MAKKSTTTRRSATRPRRKPGPSQMPPKWLQVIDLMVIGGLDFQAAMASAGYSAGYYTTNGHQIKQDARFCKAYEHRMHMECTKNVGRRDRLLRVLDKIIDNPSATDRDIIAAAKEQGALCGLHSETIKHETTERQAALDAAARQEAARLASLALDTRQLPDVTPSCKQVQSIIVESSVSGPIQAAGMTDSDTADSDVLAYDMADSDTITDLDCLVDSDTQADSDNED